MLRSLWRSKLSLLFGSRLDQPCGGPLRCNPGGSAMQHGESRNLQLRWHSKWGKKFWFLDGLGRGSGGPVLIDHPGGPFYAWRNDNYWGDNYGVNIIRFYSVGNQPPVAADQSATADAEHSIDIILTATD